MLLYMPIWEKLVTAIALTHATLFELCWFSAVVHTAIFGQPLGLGAIRMHGFYMASDNDSLTVIFRAYGAFKVASLFVNCRYVFPEGVVGGKYFVALTTLC